MLFPKSRLQYPLISVSNIPKIYFQPHYYNVYIEGSTLKAIEHIMDLMHNNDRFQAGFA